MKMHNVKISRLGLTFFFPDVMDTMTDFRKYCLYIESQGYDPKQERTFMVLKNPPQDCDGSECIYIHSEIIGLGLNQSISHIINSLSTRRILLLDDLTNESLIAIAKSLDEKRLTLVYGDLKPVMTDMDEIQKIYLNNGNLLDNLRKVTSYLISSFNWKQYSSVQLSGWIHHGDLITYMEYSDSPYQHIYLDDVDKGKNIRYGGIILQ